VAFQAASRYGQRSIRSPTRLLVAPSGSECAWPGSLPGKQPNTRSRFAAAALGIGTHFAFVNPMPRGRHYQPDLRETGTMPQKTSAQQFLPARMNLRALRAAAEFCEGCELYKNATQTVFGEGPRHAALLLLGEVPGDEEDKQGHPFVGPAGRMLDEALEEVGLSHDDVYITNAVKHFRWEPRGKRRLHKKPSARHIEACRPWLHAEILVVKPQGIVCLGATAAQSMLGREFRITKQRGKFFKGEAGARHPVSPLAGSAWLMATYHPSAVLRAPEKKDRDRMRSEFTEDLHHAAERLATSVSGAGNAKFAAP
jgi:uracil-DNA glycosylase